MNIDVYISAEDNCSYRLVNCDTGLIWDFDTGVLTGTFTENCVADAVASEVAPGFNILLPKRLPAGQYYLLINDDEAANVLVDTAPDSGKKFYCVGEGVAKPSITDIS